MSVDSSQFNDLYSAMYVPLFRIVKRITGNEDAAEEIVQDTFIKVLDYWSKFETTDDARYWLIRVAQNAAINWAKRSSKEHKLYQRVYSEQHVGMDGPEQTHLKTETEQLVQKALQMLPEKFKRVLILKEYGELDYKEIGKVLGITEGNVKVRVFRAREALAKALEELGYEVS